MRQPYSPGDTTRTCTNCRRARPLTAFNFRKNRRGVLLPRAICRDCESANRRTHDAENRDYVNRRSRTYRVNNPEPILRNAMRQSARNVGLDPDDIEAYYAAHNGLCDICGKPPTDRRLAVEHNHTTGEFRGLTCRKCNAAIAFFDDNPEFLTAAIAYFSRDMSGLIRKWTPRSRPNRRYRAGRRPDHIET